MCRICTVYVKVFVPKANSRRTLLSVSLLQAAGLHVRASYVWVKKNPNQSMGLVFGSMEQTREWFLHVTHDSQSNCWNEFLYHPRYLPHPVRARGVGVWVFRAPVLTRVSKSSAEAHTPAGKKLKKSLSVPVNFAQKPVPLLCYMIQMYDRRACVVISLMRSVGSFMIQGNASLPI